MPRSVLIPLDRTEQAERALSTVRDICEKDDVIVLLSIGDAEARHAVGRRPGRSVLGPSGTGSALGPDVPVFAETGEQALQRLRSELEDYVEEKAQGLRDYGFTVRTIVDINDSPEQAIVSHDREMKPSFILMTRKTHSSVGDRLFGTVAGHIVSEAVAPVMLTPV